MEILKQERKLCSCCMEEHDVKLVRDLRRNIYKNQLVEYYAIFEYCDLADEYQASDEMISENDISMKNAYREANGLLTVEQINGIRKKYNISQKDLSNMLGWGEKTITRYETHQIQDMAHDTILRKIDTDPEWFLCILETRKEQLKESAYRKYYESAVKIFEENQDAYLRKAIVAQYIKYGVDDNYTGGTKLNIDKLIDVVRYFANSEGMRHLYKVKMMKLLWYADALSYKRHGHSLTGLIYRALPMGAVPIAHHSIMELKGLSYIEIGYDDKTGYQFKSDHNYTYPTLAEADISVLDTVIAVCGKDTRNEIVERMHKERAYTETEANEIIQYKYAKDLSLC